MLLNNFIPLLDFYRDATFVNVLGDTVNKTAVMAGQNYQNPTTTSNMWSINNHSGLASNLTYNYSATSQTNSYTQEKELYNWANVVGRDSGDLRGDSNALKRNNGFVIFVGTGDTEVTAEDYCLDSAIELEVTGAFCYHSAFRKTQVGRTFLNSTADAVTIKEIGLYMFTMNNYSYAAGRSENFPLIMIGRKVLTTPVTLEVGDLYTFTYEIDMSGITFEEADAVAAQGMH